MPSGVTDLLEPMRSARDLALTTGERLLALAAERPQDALAGATPYLRLLATVVATGLVLRGAVAAQQRLDAGDHGPYSAAFLRARVLRARILVTRVLPVVHGLAPVVTAGADDLFALSPDDAGI